VPLFLRRQCRPDGELSGGRIAFELAVRKPHPAAAYLRVRPLVQHCCRKGSFLMKQILNSVRLSAKELGSIRAITVCGMLLALRIVLSMFTIHITAILRISFSYLPIAAVGMIFGPVAGGVFGVAGDILGYFICPTGPYFPGFTLNAFLSGFVYGVFFYRKPVSLRRTFSAKALITFLISILLNPLWLSILYGKAFFAVVSARIVTNLVMFPIEATILHLLLKMIEKSRVTRLIRKNC
jgi:riboflavin transporter